MTFHTATEGAITSLLFRKDGSQGMKHGLPSPIFWWTHRALTPEAAVVAEADYAKFLLLHLLNSGTTRESVSVVVANDDVRKVLVAKCNAGRAAVFAPRIVAFGSTTPSADDASSHQPQQQHNPVTTDVVIFLMGGFASGATANALRGPALTQTFQSASDALIIIGHAAWRSHMPGPAGSQHPVAIGWRKLADEPWRMPVTREEVATGLVGGILPLCCSSHGAEVFFATEDTVRSGDPSHCRRVCLTNYVCHNPLHVCLSKCHSDADHTKHSSCLYTCGTKMPCGHKCEARCGDVCNCFQHATKQLECSHTAVVGLEVDEAGNETPMSQLVKHAFDGACCEKENPCEVPIPVHCRLCAGPMTVPCHAFAAAKAQAAAEKMAAASAAAAEANDNEEESAAGEEPKNEHEFLGFLAECERCIEERRTLEKNLLVELLMEADAQRENRRRAAEGQLHEQHKAALAGMFSEGQRVMIKDISGVRGPIDYLFPDIESKPAGLGWSNAPLSDLLGDQGRVVARHVDLTDTNEVLYLVSLARGGHTVVADTGLSLLKAVINTAGVTAKNSGDGFGSALLITGGPSAASYAQGGNDDTTGGGDNAESDAEAKLRIDFPVGSFVHCIEPVERLPDGGEPLAPTAGADQAEGAADLPPPLPRETNIAGKVERVEGTYVYVACERRRHDFEDTADVDLANIDSNDDDDATSAVSGVPSAKSHRAEGAETAAPRIISTTERFTVRAERSQIDVLMAPGDPGVATEPRRHVHDPVERAFFDLPDEFSTFVPIPLAATEAVSVRAVVNYPYLAPGVSPLYRKSRGPCLLVTPMRDRGATVRIAIVPAVFVDPDADAKAEKDLHKDLQAKLLARLDARFQDMVEPRALSNIETRRKRLLTKGRILKKQMAANGGKLPDATATWGGGLKSALLERPPSSGTPPCGPLDRHAIHAAAKRNETATAQEPRRLADLKAEFLESAERSARYDDELRKALAPKMS